MMTADMLDTMVNRIVKQLDPDGILLFGSRARGDAREWSDVDLMIIMNTVLDKRKTAIDTQMLLKDLFISKDIIVVTKDEIHRKRNIVGTLIHAALQDGRMLYERS